MTNRRGFLGLAASLAATFRGTPAGAQTLSGGQKALDLEDVHEFLDPKAVLVTAANASVPQIWQAYLTLDHSARMKALDVELDLIRRYLPKAAAAIRDVTKDVFVVSFTHERYGQRFARVLNKLNTSDSPPDSELYAGVSFSIVPQQLLEPKNKLFLERAPKALSYIYNHMFDGLRSVIIGGLLPLYEMGTLHSLADVYGETDWYEAFVKTIDPKLVYEICQNGGGINILLDLNDASVATSDDPNAIWVDVKGGEFDRDLPMWDFIDSMMSIIFSGR